MDGLSSNLEFEFERNQQLGFKHQTSIQVQKKDHAYKSSPKHGVNSSNNTSMYELTLEFKNKLKTLARQCKNYPKIYHKLFMIKITHGKMTLRN